MKRLTLDLNYSYTDSQSIDNALEDILERAVRNRSGEIEIITGTRSVQLVKKIERFLQQPAINRHYQRMQNDSRKTGRIVLYFKY